MQEERHVGLIQRLLDPWVVVVQTLLVFAAVALALLPYWPWHVLQFQASDRLDLQTIELATHLTGLSDYH